MPADARIYDDNNSLVTDLQDWLTGDLRESLLSMNLWREMFDSWRDILTIVIDEDAVPLNGYLVEFVRRNYGTYITMAIRREVDAGIRDREPPRSLRMFLGTVKANAHLLNKDWFMERAADTPELFPGIDNQWATVATPDTEHIDPEKVQADIDLTWCMGESAHRWATRNIAHSLPSGTTSPAPKYDEVEQVINVLLNVWRRWYVTVTADFIGELPPVYWEGSMTKRWITDEQAYQIAQERRTPGTNPYRQGARNAGAPPSAHP